MKPKPRTLVIDFRPDSQLVVVSYFCSTSCVDLLKSEHLCNAFGRSQSTRNKTVRPVIELVAELSSCLSDYPLVNVFDPSTVYCAMCSEESKELTDAVHELSGLLRLSPDLKIKEDWLDKRVNMVSRYVAAPSKVTY